MDSESCWVSSTGFWILGFGCSELVITGFWILDFGFSQSTGLVGFWIQSLDSEKNVYAGPRLGVPPPAAFAPLNP